jgi:hypothetical protein
MARFIQINDMPKLGRFYSTIASDCILSPEMKYLNLFSVEDKKGNWQELYTKLFDQLRNYQNDGYG